VTVSLPRLGTSEEKGDLYHLSPIRDILNGQVKNRWRLEGVICAVEVADTSRYSPLGVENIIAGYAVRSSAADALPILSVLDALVRMERYECVIYA